MFDIKIADSLGKDEDMLHTVWNNLIKMTMLERFGGFEWMQDWANGQSFDNAFLVRKPRMPVAFLDLENGQEVAVTASQGSQISLMEATFLKAELIQSHVANPAQAWTSMMQLNDGGVDRLSDYLAKVSTRQAKLDRISEQMEEVLHDLVENRLSRWFAQDGMGEVEAKKKIAQSVVSALTPRIRLLAEIQEKLQLPEPLLQGLYMGADVSTDQSDVTATDSVPSALNIGDDPFGLGDDLDLFGDKPTAAPASEKSKPIGSDARFAQAVLREWINHLRGIPSEASLLTYLGLPKASAEMMCDELITGATRLDLQNALFQVVSRTEQVGTKREKLVDRQVLAAKTVFSDYIAWLGYVSLPLSGRPESRVNKGHRLFEQPQRIQAGALPQITNEPIEHTRAYMGDWLVGLAQLIVENAGHDAGREIRPDQNAELGGLIAKFNSARVSAT
jgi:hypothetical protein